MLQLCVVEHDWDAPPDGIGDLLADISFDRLLRLAAHHSVHGMVRCSLRNVPGVPADGRQALEEAFRSDTFQHLRTLADLRTFARWLEGSSVPWMVFKGPVLAERSYAHPALRHYGDLDLLVPQVDFARVVALLDAEGAEVMDRNWSVINTRHRAQLHLQLPMGTVVDLHWSLVNDGVVRSSLAVDTAGVLERSSLTTLGGTPVRVPEATDAVLHLVLHAGLAGGSRLLWLKDIERAIATDPPDWDVVVRRAGEWQASLLVGAVLQRACRCLGASVPPEVVRSLVPPGFRGVSRLLDRAWPPERARGRHTPAGIWTRSLRDDLPSTLVSFGEKARRGEGFAPALRQWLTRTPARALDGWEASGALRPTGGEQDRDQYLARVGRRAEPTS